MISCVKVLTLCLCLKTSATERFLDKADHKNLLFVLLKEYSGMRCSVGAILTIYSYYSYSVDVVFLKILMLGLSRDIQQDRLEKKIKKRKRS